MDVRLGQVTRELPDRDREQSPNLQKKRAESEWGSVKSCVSSYRAKGV